MRPGARDCITDRPRLGGGHDARRREKEAEERTVNSWTQTLCVTHTLRRVAKDSLA